MRAAMLAPRHWTRYALPMDPLPPTSETLRDGATRPYFLWWTALDVAAFRQCLRSPDEGERAYYLGALLREANTRDVWLFTSPREIAALWPAVYRYLGKARSRWAWLLQLPDPGWPPPESRGSPGRDDAHVR